MPDRTLRARTPPNSTMVWSGGLFPPTRSVSPCLRLKACLKPIKFKSMASLKSQKHHLGLALLSLLLCLSLSNSQQDPPSPSPSLSVYEILPKYGLPSGLLPSAVTNYTLSKDGRFVVLLEKPCYVQFEYLVYYEKQVTGKLSYGSITDLKGIQVQRFFLWFNVDEIRVDLPSSGSIYFRVGFINKKLDVDQFKTVHSCRDGVSGSCGEGLLSRFLELPTPTGDIEMLITE